MKYHGTTYSTGVLDGYTAFTSRFLFGQEYRGTVHFQRIMYLH